MHYKSVPDFSVRSKKCNKELFKDTKFLSFHEPANEENMLQ